MWGAREWLLFLGCVCLTWASGVNTDGCLSGPPPPDDPWPAIFAGVALLAAGVCRRPNGVLSPFMYRRLLGMEKISVTDLRPKLKETISIVQSGSPVAVTRVNLPQAVMVDVDFYERAVEAFAEEEKALSERHP